MTTNNLKIVVLGSSGMLGADILNSLDKNHNIITPTRKECDFENFASIEKFFQKIRHADTVINCVAMTNVDLCEDQSNLAFKINATAVRYLAKSCEKTKIPLIHISTDYVFSGEQEQYGVKDIPSPLSIYGRSKLLAEQYISSIMSRYFIVRTAWLYGKNGKNFVKTILNLSQKENYLKIVNDQKGCPTYTQDLAQAIIRLINTDNYGIHHACGEGSCSWYDFAKTILELKNIQKEILPISTKKSYTLFPYIKAQRPKSSKLINSLPMRTWEESLKEFLITL